VKPPGAGRRVQRAETLPLIVFVVFVVGAIWAIGFLTSSGSQRRPPTGEETNIGAHLARGDGFLSPMDDAPTAPVSAWSPPIYPLVIAAAYRMFGTSSLGAVTCLMVINALCFGGIAAALTRLGTLVFGSLTPGLLAAAFVAIDPFFLFYLGDFWDGLLSLSIFMWLTVAAIQLGMAFERGEQIRGRSVLAFGVGMGLLALTNVSYCTTYPVLLCVAFWKRPALFCWRSSAIAGVAFLVMIAPWTIRNYDVFGQFIFIRTGSGVQFWLGNAPVSNGWLDSRAYAFHPYVNRDERASLLALGEPAYNAQVFRRFEDSLGRNPWIYVTNCLRRTIYLFVSNPRQPAPYPFFPNWQWRGIFWDSLLLNGSLAFLGLAGMFAARRPTYRQWGLPALVAAIALPFVATAVIDRYSIPLRCLLLLYAAGLVWMLVRKLTGHVPGGRRE
jgi:hypothetical protein